MAKYIQVPFSQLGDSLEVPFKPDGNSILNFQQGFTNVYELNPDAGGEYLLRTNFNYMFGLFTSTIQELQRSRTRDFDNDILQNGGYNAGEGCLLNYNIYTRQIMQDPLEYDNTESTYYSKVRAISLRNNNTTNPYDENALFDSWLLDDGVPLGFATFDYLNLEKTPAGYLRVNASDIATKQFSLSIYKRVRELLKDLKDGEKRGIFIKVNDTNFMLQDVRGMFPRVWSNGSSVDSARVFNNTQEPALPNIIGTTASIFAVFEGGRASGAFYTLNQNRNGNAVGSGVGYNLGFNAANSNSIYKDSHNDVTPYNFNMNLFVKV